MPIPRDLLAEIAAELRSITDLYDFEGTVFALVVDPDLDGVSYVCNNPEITTEDIIDLLATVEVEVRIDHSDSEVTH